MMAYVQVPKDLTEIKNKIIFGLTKRQLICFSIATVTGFSSYIVLKDINIDLAMMIMFILSVPIFMFGIFEKDGQNLEMTIYNYIKSSYIYPKRRIYRSSTRNMRGKGGNIVKNKKKGSKK